MEKDIIKTYQKLAGEASENISKYQKLIDTYSFMRLGTVGMLLLSIYVGARWSDFTMVIASFFVVLLTFAWLVSRQSKFDSLKRYYQDLLQVIQNEIQNISSRQNIYDNGAGFADSKHLYSSDLDIFGDASLFQMVNRTATRTGSQRLADWLSAAADKDDILLRQEAVKELSAKSDWKLDMQARLLFSLNRDGGQLQRLFTYLDVPLKMNGERWLSSYAKVAPYLMLAAVVLAFFYPAEKYVAILLGLVHLGIIFSKASYINKTDLIADKMGIVLARYSAVFERIEKGPWESKYLGTLSSRIREERVSAAIGELSRLIIKLNYRLNMLVGFMLNVFFLWDIRQVIAIEQWKRNNRQNLNDAFNVIAEYEALISLASLHSNYPDWCLPQIADGDNYTLIATNLAHPLISDEVRVSNDYRLDHTLNIDIVTGSNMAGKSTFLRTIGINTVLALCGAPVCAARMQVSVMEVLTYMRIKDSLSESTSTFKAEIDRLKMLLTEVAGNKKVFFLIDEMLRGTNSVDKYKGSKAVIEQLIHKRGVGLVATHDLQIADLEKQHPDYIRNFYFDIRVEEGEMTFDYKIKPGECKTFNASLLLKQIGIDVDA